MDKKLYNNNIWNKLFDVFIYVFTIAVVIIMLYPFVNQIAISLSDSAMVQMGGIYLIPKKLTFTAYDFVLANSKLTQAALISLLRVVVGTVTGVLANALLAYLVINDKFGGRKFLRRIFVITMFFGGGLIPTYLLLVRLGLTDTFTVYWLPRLFVPYYMLMIAAYMQTIPKALLESARIDGASELRIFWQIMIPLSVPVLAAIAVFISVYHWNDWFTVSIYNPGGDWDTLQIYLKRILLEAEILSELQNQTAASIENQGITPETIRAATTIIVTIPIALVYPFFQKYFIAGIKAGAVKE